MVCLAVAGERLTERLKGESFKAMLKQKISWFDYPENTLGSMIYRITADVVTLNKVTILV